jgi:hypothetical protein
LISYRLYRIEGVCQAGRLFKSSSLQVSSPVRVGSAAWRIPVGKWIVLSVDSLYRAYEQPIIYITLYGSNDIDDKKLMLGYKRSLNQKPIVLAESGITDPDQDEFIKHFMCPITGELMNDPVVTPNMHRFERKAIEEWVRSNGSCPISREPLRLDQLKPDFAVKSAIQGYIKK